MNPSAADRVGLPVRTGARPFPLPGYGKVSPFTELFIFANLELFLGQILPERSENLLDIGAKKAEIVKT